MQVKIITSIHQLLWSVVGDCCNDDKKKIIRIGSKSLSNNKKTYLIWKFLSIPLTTVLKNKKHFWLRNVRVFPNVSKRFLRCGNVWQNFEVDWVVLQQNFTPKLCHVVSKTNSVFLCVYLCFLSSYQSHIWSLTDACYLSLSSVCPSVCLSLPFPNSSHGWSLGRLPLSKLLLLFKR